MLVINAGNTAVHILLCLGICLGVIGGLFTSVKNPWKDEPLCYSNGIVQAFCRCLFVVACALSLFADFPGMAENRFAMFNWLVFPIVGFINFVSYWFLAFWSLIALKAIFRWVFASTVIGK